METPLCALALKYRSDKCPALGHFYTSFYDHLFSNRRNEVKKVLEIGVGYPETMPVENYLVGASLFMWRDYFPNAEIFAIDNRADAQVQTGRIKSFIVDQSNSSQLIDFVDRIVGKDFDLIVDDGSHKADHQIVSAIALIPYVKAGGYYIIEDVSEPDKVVNALSEFGHKCEVVHPDPKALDNRLIVISK